MNSKVQKGKKDSSFRAETQPMKSHGLQVARVVKNPPTNAGDLRDCGSILERERSSRGNVNLLQYFSILAGRIPWMEEDMGRGVWQATVQGATKSQTARASEYTLFTRTYSFLYLPRKLFSFCCHRGPCTWLIMVIGPKLPFSADPECTHLQWKNIWQSICFRSQVLIVTCKLRLFNAQLIRRQLLLQDQNQIWK